MGSGKKHWLALALSLNLFFVQAIPLLAATTRQLQDTVRNSGLVGARFQVWRQGGDLRVETDQIYPNRDELKLALIQLASLVESTDGALRRVTLRGYLLNNPQAVEGSIAPRTATQLQRQGNPDMLDSINLAAARKTSSKSLPVPVVASNPQESGDDIPVLGEPIDPPATVPARTQKSARQPVTAAKDIPVIGEPLYPGQRVVGSASADDNAPAPFQTGVSILRAGSPIPVMLNRDIVVDGNRSVPVEAIVLQDILSDSGQLVIPGGSQVRGVVEPTPSGARLKLRELYVGDRQYSIQAASSVYPAQVQQYGGNGSGGLIGGLAGGFGGMAIGNSLNNRGGGLWGGLLGGLLGSWVGSSMSQPVRRTTTVIPAGTTNAQLLEDLSITSY